MTDYKHILCACLGNSDRSPFMASFLQKMLEWQDLSVKVSSAGVLESTKEGDPAPEISVKAACTYGINLSDHYKKHYSQIADLDTVDLIVVADKECQASMLGVIPGVEIICLNLDGRSNAWKTQNPRNVDDMIADVIKTLITEVIQWRFRGE
jgi:protein-tyrosine-phosphatase